VAAPSACGPVERDPSICHRDLLVRCSPHCHPQPPAGGGLLETQHPAGAGRRLLPFLEMLDRAKEIDECSRVAVERPRQIPFDGPDDCAG
jgi:hypothetical protein